MATETTITSNYAGVEIKGPDAGGFFLETFKEADALKNGILTVYPNINFEAWLRKLETTNGRRNYTCGHVPNGSVTLSERLLKPKKFKDDFDLCKEDFRVQWGEASMGASAHNDAMDKNAMDATRQIRPKRYKASLRWRNSVMNVSIAYNIEQM
jgi:hypothetical protein